MTTPESPTPPPGRSEPLGQWIRRALTVRFALAMARLIPMLSLENAQRLGRSMTVLASLFSAKRRKRLHDHLKIAFPDMGAAEKNSLARSSWRAMGDWVAESVWQTGWTAEHDDARIRFANQEVWDRTFAQARERGKGLIIFVSHLGAIEVLAQWFPRYTQSSVMMVAARPKLPEVEEYSRRIRESGGLKLVYRGEAGVATMRHLRAGGVLLMAVDHNLDGAGVEIPFFGKGAHTLLAPARLALQSGALATTMFCLREGRGRYRIECDEPIEMQPFPRDEESRFLAECRLAMDYTRRIEAKIRQYPGQYLWMHKRWQKRSETQPLPPSLQ